MHTNYLEFFYMRCLSLLFHLFIYQTFIYFIGTHRYLFYTWVIIQYFVIYSDARIVPVLAIVSAFRLASVSLWHKKPIFFFFFFGTLPYFLALQHAPSSSCIFPAPVLESAISPRSSGSLNWRMLLETKIWALDVTFFNFESFLYMFLHK